jgi:DHA2 family methylenomycin A resistance protein-like MFS transporter
MLLVTTNQTGADQRTGRRLTLIALSLGLAVVQLDVTVVNVAVKQIGSSLHSGVSAMQWVVSAYTLGFAALILTAGALGDRTGAKRLFLGGFALFTAASASCALAPNVTVLVLARAVQGLGAAALAACSLALLNHEYHDPAERARAVSWWAFGASIALAAGPVVGGVLIAAFSWRAIFLINVPIGLVGMWLTARYANETQRHTHGIDLPGQASAIIALAALAAAMIEGGELGWTSAWALGGFVVFAIAGAAFLLSESRVRTPMLPLALFMNRTFRSAALIGLLVNISYYGLIFVFSLLLQREQGRSALSTGLAFLPMTAAIAGANVISGRLAARLGPRKLIIAGLALMACGCAALLGADAHSSYASIAAQMIALGAGIGLMVPPMTSSLMGSVDRKRSGVASGTLQSMRQTGSVIGVALFGSLIASGSFVDGFRLALVISIVVLAAGCALAASGIDRDRRSSG